MAGETEVLGVKSAPVLLCPPQIPYDRSYDTALGEVNFATCGTCSICDQRQVSEGKSREELLNKTFYDLRTSAPPVVFSIKTFYISLG
jgi:hypothetical protein